MELVAVLENPNYIMNIGNVVRNVNGLGISKLLVVDGLKRLENELELIQKRKSLIKHSSGAVQSTEIVRFDSSKECLDFLSANGFVSVGTAPIAKHQQSFYLHESKLDQEKLAIWFGDEANGLTDTVLQQCDFCLTIKMNGKVESLNLATTTGIVLYEATKQRNK